MVGSRVKKYPRLFRTLIVAAVSSTISGYAAYYIQSTANKRVTACSYLDPITIDIVATIAGLFLFVEGLVDIFQHKDSLVRNQITRCLRVCFGTSILVIHIMQFIRK